MSLFSVVRFANSFCYGSNGLNGTCYTSAECTSLGGVAAGSCASGFGVCCTSKLNIRQENRHLITYTNIAFEIDSLHHDMWQNGNSE